MTFIDWAVVVVFLLGLLALGMFLSRRAGKNTEEYILGGRKMPWWLAGTSIAATGLNASTMLSDSRKIRQDGLSGLWFTWATVVGNIVNAVWFGRLWRRAGFTTQMEFYHARYTGVAATIARTYDSVVYGVIVSGIWAAVGLVGMKKIASVLLGLPPQVMLFGAAVSTDLIVIVVLLAVTLVYSAASGVHGVVWTDLIEFVIAISASFILMIFVYRDVGWNTGLHDKLVSLGSEGDRLLSFMPAAIPVLIYFMILQPIASMGAYVPSVQRFLCLKNEREALFTAFYSAFVNFVLKPWPFYVCGLCGIFVVSDQFLAANYQMIAGPDGAMIPDYQKVFPLLVQQYLPVGMVGMMAAAFLSAFMSSFDTNIHNSTAIVINDIYRPYLAPNRDEHHYVRASRIYMVLVTILASLIGILSQDILKLTMFAIAISLSPGLVKLLRFIWWRVNGITEVITQGVSLVVAVVMISPLGTSMVNGCLAIAGISGNDAFHITRQFFLIGFSTVVSVIVILCTKPEPMPHLCQFYKRVRPFGWWGPVREACGPEAGTPDSFSSMILVSASGVIALFAAIFAILGFLLALWPLCIGAVIGLIPSVWGTIVGIRRLYPGGAEK